MEQTKYINGVLCTFSEEKFSIEEFHKDDQNQFSNEEPFIKEVDIFGVIDENGDGFISRAEWIRSGRSLDEFEKLDTNGDGVLSREEFEQGTYSADQNEFSAASYRVRLQEMKRPVFMRLKIMVRDTKMMMKSGNLDEKEVRNLKRLFTDDLTSLIQESLEMTRSGSGQTVDLILKLNTLGNKEITDAGRNFGRSMRRINRIREKMGFIPKMQQDELNSSLTGLVAKINALVFSQTDLKTYSDVNKS